jgi:hypothetical protein
MPILAFRDAVTGKVKLSGRPAVFETEGLDQLELSESDIEHCVSYYLRAEIENDFIYDRVSTNPFEEQLKLFANIRRDINEDSDLYYFGLAIEEIVAEFWDKFAEEEFECAS